MKEFSREAEQIMIERFGKDAIIAMATTENGTPKETLGGRRKSVKEVPIWEKSNLSLEEAAAYSGIGVNKLRELTNEKNCRFVLWVGNKRLIKRRLFDQYIEQEYSI